MYNVTVRKKLMYLYWAISNLYKVFVVYYLSSLVLLG